MPIRSKYPEKLKRYWNLKLKGRTELVDRFLQGCLQLCDCKLSTNELVAACSLMIVQKQLYEVLASIEILANECVDPIFTDEFFVRYQAEIQAMERAGWRTQARKMRKLGHAIAAGFGAKSWQGKWSQETSRQLAAAIRDEPFLPQRG